MIVVDAYNMVLLASHVSALCLLCSELVYGYIHGQGNESGLWLTTSKKLRFLVL